MLRDHRDRVDGTYDRALLAADAIVLDDDRLARRVRILRQRELPVHHVDRFEGAVVEAVGAPHADLFVHDRERAAASDVLLRADLEPLLVPLLCQREVHLADVSIVRHERIRRRARRGRGRLRGDRGRRRQPDHLLLPGRGGSYRFASTLLPVGYSPGSPSARNCVTSITLNAYRSSPGFHFFSWWRQPKWVRHLGHATRR